VPEGKALTGAAAERGEGGGGDIAPPAPPLPIGYSPSNLCELNTPDSMGRICIIHEPSAQYLPVRPGRYRIVMAAASKTGYSFSVMARTARAVPETVEVRMKECETKMRERPRIKQELYELTQSVRLSERKYRLVEGLIAESEQTCEDLQRQIGALNAKLKYDANKDGLTREQAREIDTGIGRLEIEFAATVKKTMSRRQELKDITEGLDRMMELKREREDNMVAIDRFLEFQRTHLASAAAAGVGIAQAAKYAKRINARFVADEHVTSKMGRRQAFEAVKQTTLLTPAQKLRRKAMNMKHAGLGVLDVVQSKWVAYDRVRCPEEWTLYSSGEESEDEDEEDDEGASPNSRRRRKAPAPQRIEVPWTRQDLVRIMEADKESLPVQEAKIQKMMKKFHDRRASDQPHDMGFETREQMKKGGKHAKKLTPEQLEFLLYDKVLHPAWYKEAKVENRWAGVDGVIGDGDGLTRRKGGYQKGLAAMKRAILDAEKKGNLQGKKGGAELEDKDRNKGDKDTVDEGSGMKGVISGPEGQDICVVREHPDPEKPAYDVLLVSATTKATKTALRHQKDGHDPNQKFVFEPLPNLVLKQEDLVALMQKDPERIEGLEDLVDDQYRHKVAAARVEDKEKMDSRLCRVYRILAKYAPPKIHRSEGSEIDRRGAQGNLDVIRHDATTPEVDTDIDKRCRTVLEEIDLSFECTAPYMQSSVMHSVPQMFPIDVLRADLERELDRLLCEQVFERERATRIMVSFAASRTSLGVLLSSGFVCLQSTAFVVILVLVCLARIFF
jgi:hypothetical protein